MSKFESGWETHEDAREVASEVSMGKIPNFYYVQIIFLFFFRDTK